jgi:hypothetical protein
MAFCICSKKEYELLGKKNNALIVIPSGDIKKAQSHHELREYFSALLKKF